jgi:Leucine-rich repeat (LRR) protein
MTTWPFKRKLAVGNMNLGESNLPVDELVKTSLGNSLYKLSLRGNLLAMVPQQLITNLPSLKHLDLTHCELSELPRIWDLPKLKVLNLSYNHISEFPSKVSCFRFT